MDAKAPSVEPRYHLPSLARVRGCIMSRRKGIIAVSLRVDGSALPAWPAITSSLKFAETSVRIEPSKPRSRVARRGEETGSAWYMVGSQTGEDRQRTGATKPVV
jgi:hypothetical protein